MVWGKRIDKMKCDFEWAFQWWCLFPQILMGIFPHWENDNNKGRRPNKELKLGIQINLGKKKVMMSSNLQYFN